MLSQAERELVVRSWRLVAQIAETAADLFYRRLFELRPDLRPIFPEDMSGQKKKLVRMLSFIVKSMDWPETAWNEDVAPDEDLFLVVIALGRRHTDLYRVPDDSYGPVGEALLWTLDYGIGKEFDAPLRSAWAKLYALVARVMKMGSRMIADRDGRDGARRRGKDVNRIPVISGRLEEEDLAGVLEALTLTRQLSCVEVSSPLGALEGAIWTKSGQLLEATAGARSGVNALRYLLDRPGTYEVLHVEDRVDGGIQPIMGLSDALDQARAAPQEPARSLASTGMQPIGSIASELEPAVPSGLPSKPSTPPLA